MVDTRHSFSDAHVPMSDGHVSVDFTPSGAPQEGMAGVQGPGSKGIQQEGVGYTGADYQPAKGRKLEPKPSKNSMIDNSVLVDISDGDYVDPEKSSKRTEDLEARVRAAAKKIYEENKAALERYKKAKKITDDPSRYPDELVSAAHRLVKKGIPMTKAEALKQARNNVTAMSQS